MPCSDITEIMTLHLDHDDLVRDYQLIKKSCGRAVGEQSLLSDYALGKSIQHHLSTTVDEFLDTFQLTDETEEFLHLKHFFAIQSAGQVLLGQASGGADDVCSVDTIAADEHGTEIIVHLAIDVITDKIKSCGRCAGCGSKKLKQKASST